MNAIFRSTAPTLGTAVALEWIRTPGHRAFDLFTDDAALCAVALLAFQAPRWGFYVNETKEDQIRMIQAIIIKYLPYFQAFMTFIAYVP